jgi:hypothetical protein
MKLKNLSILAVLGLLAYSNPAEAQLLKKFQKSLEDKASQKVDDVLNGKKKAASPAAESTAAKDAPPPVEEVYSFTPGSTILFESDFKRDSKGSMPKRWKTSSTGSVVSIPDMPGNWLALAPRTTYKIDSLLKAPENFTIEFDLVTRSDEAKDIGSMAFGFARDNSIKNYISDAYNDNAITNTQFHFHNRDINNSSSDTKVHNTLSYPFANYANGLLHVAIAVEGETMRVYVNRSKVLDTKMLRKDLPKYFYLSAPFSYDNQAKVYFGNFVMSKS